MHACPIGVAGEHPEFDMIVRQEFEEEITRVNRRQKQVSLMQKAAVALRFQPVKRYGR